MNLPVKTNEYCIEGIMPKLYISDDANKIVNAFENTITNYLNNGFKNKDIVNLTLNTEEN